jgi:hypothetical protein
MSWTSFLKDLTRAMINLAKLKRTRLKLAKQKLAKLILAKLLLSRLMLANKKPMMLRVTKKSPFAPYAVASL